MTEVTEGGMPFAIAPAPPVALRVRGSSALFPANRIFCIGRNYADHALEMGHDPTREPPFFFCKHARDIVTDGRFPYPRQSRDVHHEVELLVALGSGGVSIREEEALSHVWGYGVGLDMTCRDLQAAAKKLGRPWEVGKSFAGAAPCSALVPATEIGHPERGAIGLSVNGTVRQRGDLGQMIWKLPEIIATLSQYFTLDAGDLILTGTPAGVGPVARGDQLHAEIEGVGSLDLRVV